MTTPSHSQALAWLASLMGSQATEPGPERHLHVVPVLDFDSGQAQAGTWFAPVWPTGVTRAQARQAIIDAGIGEVTVEQAIDGVSLGLGILTHARVHRWEDLDAVLPEYVQVTDEQLELLHAVEPLLALVSVTVRRDGRSEKGVKIQVCCTCGRWLLFCGTAPTKCRMTIDCPGQVVTVKPGAVQAVTEVAS